MTTADDKLAPSVVTLGGSLTLKPETAFLKLVDPDDTSMTSLSIEKVVDEPETNKVSEETVEESKSKVSLFDFIKKAVENSPEE